MPAAGCSSTGAVDGMNECRCTQRHFPEACTETFLSWRIPQTTGWPPGEAGRSARSAQSTLHEDCSFHLSRPRGPRPRQGTRRRATESARIAKRFGQNSVELLISRHRETSRAWFLRRPHAVLIRGSPCMPSSRETRSLDHNRTAGDVCRRRRSRHLAGKAHKKPPASLPSPELSCSPAARCGRESKPGRSMPQAAAIRAGSRWQDQAGQPRLAPRLRNQNS